MTTPSRRRRVSRTAPPAERRSTNMSNVKCAGCGDLVAMDVCALDARGRYWCPPCVLATLRDCDP